MNNGTEDVEVILTRHGAKRVSQRVGIPKKAVMKNAQKAIKFGVTMQESRGKLRNYLGGVYNMYETANNLRAYNRYVYVFVDQKLITVLHIPKKFHDTADIQQQKKKEKIMEEINHAY